MDRARMKIEDSIIMTTNVAAEMITTIVVAATVVAAMVEEEISIVQVQAASKIAVAKETITV